MDTENQVIVIGDASALAEPPKDVVNVDAEAGSKLPKQAKLNDDGTVTLTLFTPVKLIFRKSGTPDDEKVYSEFTMRRLKGADMTAIADAPKGQTGLVAIARSAGVPPVTFKHIFAEMDAVDINAAGEVVSYFLENGPTTGR